MVISNMAVTVVHHLNGCWSCVCVCMRMYVSNMCFLAVQYGKIYVHILVHCRNVSKLDSILF